jgi:hypothetical protein
MTLAALHELHPGPPPNHGPLHYQRRFSTPSTSSTSSQGLKDRLLPMSSRQNVLTGL